MQCVLVTPEATLLDSQAEFVALTLFDGEIGIGPGHAPLIGRLGCGEMRIRQADKQRRFYIEGGFVEVCNDVVSVLTGRAVEAEKIDAAEAERLLAEALHLSPRTPEQFAQRDRTAAQARAMLRVARG